ncbi:hypothetical protein CV102_04480 [Natronococcus pandeyae]|uniref:Halobacterial output domain-containing protein n=1 Tax=Natronococcus pandeyae TaxID=2055836 RepID=A0A8J8Q5A0_9EURY|nr:HalOD1 output domain-containing protein [Natronococcus pandeyae]TYL39556.1 hypothetical protein CV102_04480 [Natronococcus pandeyae]
MKSQTMRRECEQLSFRVIEAIADTMETDVIDLQPPLYSVIDPTALDLLFSGSGPIRVEFGYEGHTILVDADRTIAVDGTVYD